MQLDGNSSVFIRHSKDENNIVSIYNDNFLLISNTIAIFNILKKFFSKKYNIKNLGKVKIII